MKLKIIENDNRHFFNSNFRVKFHYFVFKETLNQLIPRIFMIDVKENCFKSN